MKICKKCNLEKTLNNFSKNNKIKDGYRRECKQCASEENKKWYIENKDVKQNKSKEYYESNKEYVLNRNVQYSKTNKDDISTYQKEYYEMNKTVILNNQKTYKKNKRNNDICYKLKSNLRSRLSNALKRNSKTGSAVKDLECSMEEFKVYLESLFQPGMTWNNYGEWHIDHKMAISKFDLSNPDELKKACHYTNLQPMWAKDNLSKGNK